MKIKLKRNPSYRSEIRIVRQSNQMVSLVSTRFNTKTWDESQRWIVHNNWVGCIYGTPKQTNQAIRETMIVLEMHNDENKIKAIGLVKNQSTLSDKTQQIYSDRNYNRYIYKSKYRLVLDDIVLAPMEKKIIAILNQLLFKGSRHLKRAQGITIIPDWIMANKYIDFLKYFKAMFITHFK